MENQLISDEQYFTFMLAGGKYAIEVTKVREILEYESITKVPKALPYMKGVMNNRGSVITVIDLRILFGFEVSNDLSDTEIVITEISENRSQAMTVGVIADSVDVVTRLELVHSDSVSFGATPAHADFVKAVGKMDKTFVLILDLEKIFRSIEAEVSEV
ncbi:MAG: purine-binding chemotaxis protein CheW [Spirochaetaceae bacterium]|nr:purine-binding chemotaxis protein CheW [Spirochaetaceae bacterium]